jgi:hypothetical protein
VHLATAFPTLTAAAALLSTHREPRSKTWMRLLLPVLPMLPMAQTIDDRQLYYDHDRDLDCKISKFQQVSTLRSNNLRIA